MDSLHEEMNMDLLHEEMNMDSLPHELREKILLKLDDKKDIYSLSQVSKSWYESSQESTFVKTVRSRKKNIKNKINYIHNFHEEIYYPNIRRRSIKDISYEMSCEISLIFKDISRDWDWDVINVEDNKSSFYVNKKYYKPNNKYYIKRIKYPKKKIN